MPGRPKRASAVSYAEEPSDDEVDAGGEEEEDELEDEAEGEGEDDASGEEDVEDQLDAEGEDEDEGEEEEEEEEQDATPAAATAPPPVKLRFKVAPPPASASAMASGSGSGSKRPTKKAKIDLPPSEEDMSEDELAFSDDGDSRRSTSPSKLTARQRARHNKDVQDTLLSLPAEGGNKKALVLTEAERIQRREENARKRKRQTEQRLQDEQDQTINRLLRAQTSKSRSKLDAPGAAAGGGEAEGSPGPDGGGISRKPSPLPRSLQPSDNMIRWVSRLAPTPNGKGELGVVNLVSVPAGKEDWLGMGLKRSTPAVEVEVEVKAE